MRPRSPLALAAAFTVTLGAISLALLAWSAFASSTASPGGAQPPRTIEVSITEGLRFDLDRFTVRSGETVRFVIENPTSINHEFVIGDAEVQRMHAAEMAGGMIHDDAHAISIQAGQTRELIYTFGPAGNLQLGCHVAGHFEAGMHADVAVTP